MIVIDKATGDEFEAKRHFHHFVPDHSHSNNHTYVLTPILKEYHFGPLVLVKTGEIRPPEREDFSLAGLLVIPGRWTSNTQTILKPIRIEGE